VAQAREYPVVKINMSKQIATAQQLISLIAGGLLLCTTGVTSAKTGDWFQPCGKVAERSSKVREFLETQLEDIGPCFLMNRSELIYIDNQNGTNFQGLYFKKLNTVKDPVRLSFGATGRPIEFVAKNKKRYALIMSGWLNHGMTLSTTQILSLQPRKNDESFKISNLIDLYDNEQCADPTASSNSCKKLEYSVVLRDGVSKEVQITSEKPLPVISGPVLLSHNSPIKSFRFEFLDENNKHKFFYDYEISANNVNFKIEDFQRFVDDIVQLAFKPTIQILHKKSNPK
jgi:hypothetical protein